MASLALFAAAHEAVNPDMRIFRLAIHRLYRQPSAEVEGHRIVRHQVDQRSCYPIAALPNLLCIYDFTDFGGE